jgi:hypothetical protein
VRAAFWIFIGAVAIAGMVTDYKRRRGGIDVLRLAIEKRRSARDLAASRQTVRGARV